MIAEKHKLFFLFFFFVHLYLLSLLALGPASTSNATGGVDGCGGGDFGVISGGG